MAETERDPHDQDEGTDEPRHFVPELYLVIVDSNIYHYVYCGYDTVMRERSTLQETGNGHRVQFVKMVLTDFDIINHVPFR